MANVEGEEVTFGQFLGAIKRLPEDDRVDKPSVWYRTQKEHWLGWLREYHDPGAYDRKSGVKRNARFAYNHNVCPEMLLYLARAIPLRTDFVEAAEKAYESGSSLMAKSGAIRKVTPWSEIYHALWERKNYL